MTISPALPQYVIIGDNQSSTEQPWGAKDAAGSEREGIEGHDPRSASNTADYSEGKSSRRERPISLTIPAQFPNLYLQDSVSRASFLRENILEILSHAIIYPEFNISQQVVTAYLKHSPHYCYADRCKVLFRNAASHRRYLQHKVVHIAKHCYAQSNSLTSAALFPASIVHTTQQATLLHRHITMFPLVHQSC
ncbi:hypothetical protein J6590_025472 [Homalodisca vitripennis]|nr:hypothetical protein J6590_025472 [Homalodisca vitripennis]